MVGLERGTVELEPHQESWREKYDEEIARLQGIVGDAVLAFEHVGSTAVEGLPAKPVIDILAVVEELDEVDDLRPVLESHGYEYRQEDVDGRVFFARGPRTNRTHYLSITERETQFYEETIAFRDYLRNNPEAAERYAAVKRRLAEKYPDDRAAYTAEKGDVIQDILERALAD
ncbi:GrpB family protein [Halopiger goleimassiliensis]|uniref:GrpB family protein n=1 Tax=Halopiger goleimassiliensis TaxID=1293048 RepID=UPI0006780D23|nr:GrpB family protein [Halopiger goleimassiliensis]